MQIGPQTLSNAGAGFAYNQSAAGGPVFSFTDTPDQYMQNPYGTMVRPILDVNRIRAEMAPTQNQILLPQSISIPTRNLQIISSQVRPMHQQETFVPIQPDQKYSTQMSARIKYLGAPVRNDIMQPLPSVQLPHTTIISAGPSEPMPLVAASAAMRENPKEMNFLPVGNPPSPPPPPALLKLAATFKETEYSVISMTEYNTCF
jgi:hypothetical protein